MHRNRNWPPNVTIQWIMQKLGYDTSSLLSLNYSVNVNFWRGRWSLAGKDSMGSAGSSSDHSTCENSKLVHCSRKFGSVQGAADLEWWSQVAMMYQTVDSWHIPAAYRQCWPMDVWAIPREVTSDALGTQHMISQHILVVCPSLATTHIPLLLMRVIPGCCSYRREITASLPLLGITHGTHPSWTLSSDTRDW